MNQKIQLFFLKIKAITYIIAIALSFVWVGGISLLYFNTIVQHPSSALKIGSTIAGKETFYESFKWHKTKHTYKQVDPSKIKFIDSDGWKYFDEDPRLNKQVKSVDLEESKCFDDFEPVDLDEDNLFYTAYSNQTPQFKFTGYIKLIFLPLFFIWFLGLLFVVQIWPNRNKIITVGIEKFRTMHCMIQAYITLAGLIFLNCLITNSHARIIETLFIGVLLASPFIMQQCLYILIFTVTKAIKDAQK